MVDVTGSSPRFKWILVPGLAAFGIRLYGLFPRLADKLTYRAMNRK